MKKIIRTSALLLSLCMAASMCACGDSSDADKEKEETTGSGTEKTIEETTTAAEETLKETEAEVEEEDDTYIPDIEQVAGTGGTLLGFDNWYLEKESAGEIFNTWTFYNEQGEPFAVQFGFDNNSGPQYIVDDFDGDGTDDIICNNQYGGDGAQRVFVFRNTPNGIEVGQEAVSGELGAMGFDVFYDAGSKQVIFSNYTDNTEQVLTVDDFVFTTWEESGL